MCLNLFFFPLLQLVCLPESLLSAKQWLRKCFVSTLILFELAPSTLECNIEPLETIKIGMN